MEYGEQTIIPAKKSFKEWISPYLFLLPALIILGIFMFYPFIQTLIRSTFLTDSLGRNAKFLGLGNYKELFASEAFWNSILVTLKFVLIVCLSGIIMGFLTALLCQKTFPGISFFSTSYAMPMAIASAGMALIFGVMLDPSIGIINKVFNYTGNILADSDLALICVGLLTGWLNSGMNFLYFSAGLANIDQSLYESASVDGANGWQKFSNITLPSLRPISFFVIVTNIINAFQAFGQINILTKGGPGQSTNVIVFDIYRQAFMNYRYGFGSAESIILFLIVMLLTLVMFSIRNKGLIR